MSPLLGTPHKSNSCQECTLKKSSRKFFVVLLPWSSKAHLRRRLLGLLALLCLPASADYSVLDFDARGDGVSDNTAAFQRALDTAGADGSGVVKVPEGRYRFEGTLVMPNNVTLEGEWRAPVRGEPNVAGSVLLVTAGKGDAEGTPFLRMGSSTVLKGITIFYPEQTKTNPPLAYPWCIQSNGATDNLTIVDVTLINPYLGVDLGTYPAGRHLVRNLYGYPLYRGLYINQVYDVGRIENIHFWPFWDIDPASPLWEFTQEQGIAFVIGKTDGQMGLNLFSIFYSVGMHFIDGPIYNEDRSIKQHLAGSGTYTNCYMDVSPCSVRIDSAMESAGITFVNSSFMAKVVIGANNLGPVTFSACGFWGTKDLTSHAALEGRGPVIFDACHFSGWDRAETGAPCIDANNRRILVTSSEFSTNRFDHQVIRLGPRIRSAVVANNSMPGGAHIINNAPALADVHIHHNAVEPRPSFVESWLVSGPFPNEMGEYAGETRRLGLYTDYLPVPDAKAALESVTPNTRRARADERGRVDLHKYCGGVYGGTAYAFVWLKSETDQIAQFELGFNDSIRLFLNGEKIYERYSPSGQECKPGFAFVEAPLKKGWNPLLVKIEDAGGRRWEFVMEAYGENGEPLFASIDKAD